MNNTTVNMNLTPQEVLIIESLRACQAVNASVDSRKTEVQTAEELMDKYMDMDMEEFAEVYEEAFGFNHMMEKFKDALLNWYSKDELLMTLEPHVTEDDIVNYIVDNIDVEFLKLMFVEAVGQESLAEELIDSDNRIFNSSSP